MTNIVRPVFKRKIKINGPCLFLVGPIGTFFARLSNYLEKKDIRTYKISFPLYEYGFCKSKLITYSKDINLFKEFLLETLIDKKIKHIFMYGNVLLPHRNALEVVDELNKQGKKIQTHIFELGYLRPNFVTLESKGVNYNSDLIQTHEFYKHQNKYKILPKAKIQRFRFRKIWKLVTFINHSFKNYRIVEFDHKLQPKPSYLWYQLKGFLLKYYFLFTEKNLKRKCFSIDPFFVAIFQVSTDSQLTIGSNISDNKEFIEKVIRGFSESKLENTNLVFKHHPRDRGYNNYLKAIKEISKKYGIAKRVFYIHDCLLSKVFKSDKCKGTVLINSTVGYQSLYHSVPLKAFGISPYNIEGLSDQKELVSFFKNPFPVDKLLFNKFYKYVLENSQINGNFDGFFPFSEVFIFKK